MLDITTVLLDIDGTLLDFEANQNYALKTAFKNHDLTLTDEVRELYNTINHKLWKDYELGLIDRDTVLYTRFVTLFETLGIKEDGVSFEKEYQSLLSEEAYLIDGAMELVEYLHKKYDLYIVTNGVATTQRKRLQKSGLDQYMKDVFISESLGYQKPQIEFFEECFKKTGKLDLKKTIIVGDTLSSDILGGNNAQILTCWYNPKSLINDLNAEVTIEVKSLLELYNYL